jgi:hypothetical protein
VRGAITGRVPAVVAATGIHTNVVAALDLTLIVPSGILAAVWLWKRRAPGYVLGAVWTVQGAVYMCALAAATLTGASADQPPIGQVVLWSTIGVGCAVSAWRMLGRRPAPVEVVVL